MLKNYFLKRLPFVWAAALAGMLTPLIQQLTPVEPLNWLLDLTVHWQWQYSLVALLSALAVMGIKPSLQHSLFVLVTAGLLAMNVWLTPLDAAPYPIVASPQNLLKATTFNVHLENKNFADIQNWLVQENSDVVALLEVTPEMLPLLDGLKSAYPFSQLRPSDDPFGLAIYSKVPMTSPQFHSSTAGTPFFTAVLELEGNRRVNMGLMHPMPPISTEYYLTREFQIADVARAVEGANPGLLMGDFNASPWSASMRGLSSSGWSRASTLQPTHTLWGGLPIDHVLISKGASRVTAKVGPTLGSDHSPVTVVLQIP